MDMYRDFGPLSQGHILLGAQVSLFAFGILICFLGFKGAGYAAQVRRDVHILTGAVVTVAGAGLSAWAVTWALSGGG